MTNHCEGGGVGGQVGGDPDAVGAAAAPLRKAGGTVGAAAAAVNSAAGQASGAMASAGSAAAAISRFGAAVSQSAADVETQLQALGTLAQNGGDDLRTAGSPGGSGGPGGPGRRAE